MASRLPPDEVIFGLAAVIASFRSALVKSSKRRNRLTRKRRRQVGTQSLTSDEADLLALGARRMTRSLWSHGARITCAVTIRPMESRLRQAAVTLGLATVYFLAARIGLAFNP